MCWDVRFLYAFLYMPLLLYLLGYNVGFFYLKEKKKAFFICTTLLVLYMVWDDRGKEQRGKEKKINKKEIKTQLLNPCNAPLSARCCT